MDKPTIRKSGQYTLEEMNKIIYETQDNADLLTHYVDRIRNYKELTEEMIENIRKMDGHSKLKIIDEYNKIVKSVNELMELMDIAQTNDR